MSKFNPVIKTCEDVTLIKLMNVPSDMTFIGEVFENIAALSVDVNMISLSEKSNRSVLAFTVKDDDFIKTVEYTSKLKDGSVKPIVSSGNCIISIVDVAMENAPGVAARVFKTLAEANVQIMLITTSESQISVLVTRADFDDAVDSLSRQFV